ncbi:hypothetical protein ACVX70_004579, partial [Vibrio alginolyticus]
FKYFFNLVLFNNLFFGFGKSAFSAQILESLKPKKMPKFVKLPHSKLYLVGESFSGVKCGKGQFTESRYLLKFRFVEFPASKSLFFALKPGSVLVAAFLRNVESVGS